MNLITFGVLSAFASGNTFEFEMHVGSQAESRFGAAIGTYAGAQHSFMLVGEPGYDVGQAADAGRFVETSLGRGGKSRSPQAMVGDNFGAAIALGDFDADGVVDYLIGTPGSTETDYFGNPSQAAGSLTVLQSRAGNPHFPQPTRDLPGFLIYPYPGYRFAEVLAVGDFDGDDIDDVAVGAPSVGPAAGMLEVFHGSASGLRYTISYVMFQGLQGLPGQYTSGTRFAAALAAGDFNHDGYDDLAIGAPGDDGVGSVTVVFGSPNSLIFANHVYLGSFDLGRTPTLEDGFGAALAAGDINGDAFADLVIGVPGMKVGMHEDAGAAVTLFGGSLANGGFNFAATSWTDPPAPQAGDGFGGAVAIGRFTPGAGADLAVAAPQADSETALAADVGEVVVFEGGAVGYSDHITIRPFNAFDGVGAEYGSVLARVPSRDADPDALAIGAPKRNQETGAVVVARLELDLFRDGLE